MDPVVVVGFESSFVLEDFESESESVSVFVVFSGEVEEGESDEDVSVVVVMADDDDDGDDDDREVDEKEEEEEEVEEKEEAADVPSDESSFADVEAPLFLSTPVAIQMPMINITTATTANKLKPSRIKLHRRFLFLFTVCTGTVGSAVICPIWLLW